MSGGGPVRRFRALWWKLNDTTAWVDFRKWRAYGGLPEVSPSAADSSKAKPSDLLTLAKEHILFHFLKMFFFYDVHLLADV